MAKVTIVIEDREEDGKTYVDVHVDSDPPFNMEDEDKHTAAQVAGIVCAQELHSYLGSDDEDDVNGNVDSVTTDADDETPVEVPRAIIHNEQTKKETE